MASPERSHWKEATGNVGIALGIVGGILWFLTHRPELLGAALLAGIGGFALKREGKKVSKAQL